MPDFNCESAELAYLRPRVSELEHALALRDKHIDDLLTENSKFRALAHVSPKQSDFEPQDQGTRTIGGRA